MTGLSAERNEGHSSLGHERNGGHSSLGHLGFSPHFKATPGRLGGPSFLGSVSSHTLQIDQPGKEPAYATASAVRLSSALQGYARLGGRSCLGSVISHTLQTDQPGQGPAYATNV